ncbi:MAG: 23S rRNA (uracil(1939)-C(5))-methyltransferase RlmD [Candidatus Tectimicrobiota bacterium]
MARHRRKIQKSSEEIQPELGGGTLTIERLAHGGYGVGHLHGLTVFVPRTAPGDLVAIRLTEQRRRYAFGEVTDLLQASPLRVLPPCPLYAQCGGCHLQHLDYAQQLRHKTVQVQEALARLGKLPDLPVLPMLPSPLPYAYRNKVLYHYTARSGALGLVARSGAGILDIPQCLLNDTQADAVLAQVRALAASQPELRQALHQVQVQLGQRSAEILLTLIVRQALSPALCQILWAQLQERVHGLYMHVKHRDTPEVFAGETQLLAGEGVIHEQVGNVRFRIEPEAFFQVNTVQMERLYALVQEAAALRGQEQVFDLYSGGGTIALTLAPGCAQVYGIELNRQATLLAMQQAAALGMSNCTFRTGKVERLVQRYLAEGVRADVAVLDPPRAGCQPEALQALALMRVPRLVYVSCSPPTLARDLRLLHDLGYRTLDVQPVDMFPQTYHIECVTTLVRQSLRP